MAAPERRVRHPEILAPAVPHRDAEATGTASSQGINVHTRNLFANLRRAVPRTGIEDFVTEGLCWTLANSREASTAFLDLVLPSHPAGASWTWLTQANFATGDGPSRPDLVGSCGDILVAIETKVDAPVDDGQLRRHRRNATQQANGREVHVLLIARQVQRTHPADQAIEWRKVQAALRRRNPTCRNPVIEQFIEFLGMEGLGRIPGPCPSHWKASIAQARRRDAYGGMTGGYIILGHKFVRSVLPDAIDELAESGADADLRAAMATAMAEPNPERSMWRLCRRWFPSYLLRHDDRLGSLVLGDRQGLRFAAGVVEELRENGIP